MGVVLQASQNGIFHYLVYLTLFVPLKIDIKSARNVFTVASWEDWTLVYTSESKTLERTKKLSNSLKYYYVQEHKKDAVKLLPKWDKKFDKVDQNNLA